jgi:hypothetical protein
MSNDKENFVLICEMCEGMFEVLSELGIDVDEATLHLLNFIANINKAGESVFCNPNYNAEKCFEDLVQVIRSHIFSSDFLDQLEELVDVKGLSKQEAIELIVENHNKRN